MTTLKRALVSGASFAGLSTAYWLKELGYEVTVVEIADGLKKGGTAVDLKGNTVEIVKRMGLYEQIRTHRLNLQLSEFKNADDVTEGSMLFRREGEPQPDDEFEIERDLLLDLLFATVKDQVEVVFNASITAMKETGSAVSVTLSDGSQRSFELVFGCDGIHSAVRRICFGHEMEYMHFLESYFSVTIVDKLLIRENTAQLFNAPGKGVMLNAYRNKTDIIFCFVAETEIPYNYRDEAQQRGIIREQFAGQGWRTAELLDEVAQAKSFYFDKLCQIRMPSWTKGRVALVGDAGYCASPAAGMGGSLAIDGAAALADALEKHGDDFAAAFDDYNQTFRPFIDQVQAEAVKNAAMLVPRTEEAIRKRNLESKAFG
jgi:2-polyprenyl-6-methoxyphenol hydroxylase-like FAD-dependent oxidoreductase